MSFDWINYIYIAEELLDKTDESYFRTAISRAYYGVFCNDDSDIDLLIVIPESEEPGYRRAQRAYSYLRGLTASTELVVVTKQEVERASRVLTSLVNQAVQRGKILYG